MNHKLYGVVDIGGTKILLLLIDQKGNTVGRIKSETPYPAEPGTIVSAVSEMISRAKSNILSVKDKPIESIGLCMAGFIDRESGIIYQSPNLFWDQPVPIKDLFEKEYGLPVIVENDTNAAVIGETHLGAARGHKNVIYVTISTGIGGGFYLNGRPYRGENGFAAEIGHTKPFGRGRKCRCGGSNCLEAWASGSAIAENASEVWESEDIGSDSISTETVFAEADRGNAIAVKIIEHAILNMGTGIANLVTLLNPSCIVIGGGVAANRKDIFEGVAARIREEAINPSVKITKLEIVPAQLEPESGIWGMYAILCGMVKE